MGLFSFIGGLLGAGSEKKAITQATHEQVDAYNKGIAEQQRQYDTTRADFQPYLSAGTTALGQYGDLIGTNGGDKQSSAIDALKASPFYQSLFRTGEENVLQTASATGGLRGGNTQTGLADFGADTLAQTIQQQLGNLGGLASMGEGATNQVSAYGTQITDAITKLLGNIGGVQASGSLAKGGLSNQMWNNAGGFLDSAVSAALGAFPGLGGGGSGGAGSFLGKVF